MEKVTRETIRFLGAFLSDPTGVPHSGILLVLSLLQEEGR
jgi:hypothetical protein